jgi:signal transduction histidine kinase
MKLFSKFFVIVVGLAVFSIGTTLLLFYAFTRSGPATFLLGASLAVLLTMGAALVLGLVNHQVIEPIRVLTTAVSRVTLGDLRQMVPVRSSDEVGKLSRDFNDMILQLAATHRQLSEATQAADERRAQLESSINGLRQGFILTNARGRIVLMNEAAKELLHASKSKIKHPTLKDFAKLLPAEIKLESDIEKVVSKQERMRFASLPFSGHFLNLYLSPVATDGEALGCVLLFEDVTEERILQRSRDEFFSIASHELRTPLTAIRGNITLIEQYFPQIVKEPDVKEMLDDIHESSIRLIDIVNDFLDVSRLEQNRMKFDMADFTVEPVIEKVIYEMGSLSHVCAPTRAG